MLRVQQQQQQQQVIREQVPSTAAQVHKRPARPRTSSCVLEWSPHTPPAPPVMYRHSCLSSKESMKATRMSDQRAA